MAALGSLSVSIKNARFWLLGDTVPARAAALNVAAIGLVRVGANPELNQFFVHYETLLGVVYRGRPHDSIEEAAAERDAFLEFASATSQPDERSAKDLADPNEPAEPGQGETAAS